MSAVLKTRPHDAVFAQTQFLRQPLHWGMWSAINDLLWLDLSHRIPSARLRQLLCLNQAHRKVFAEIISGHFQVDSGGFVHSPALSARHATDMTNYRQKVEAGRSGGIASTKARTAASAEPPGTAPKEPNPGIEDF